MRKDEYDIIEISTHAPRTGSDHPTILHCMKTHKAFQPTLPARGATIYMRVFPSALEISTHAPRTGSDKTSGKGERLGKKFQPTLPARGATIKS